MRYSIAFILFITISINCISQNISGEAKDSTLKSKMDEYTTMLKKADAYQAVVEAQLSVITLYKKEARHYLDSAYIVAKKAEIDKSNAELYIMQFNFLYEICSHYTKKADSALSVALANKDTASMLNKEAEAFYLKLTDDYKPVLQQDTLHPAVFTVQLGAGKMGLEYFDKIDDVEQITPSDGIRRYVTGKFKTKEEALEYRKKIIELGYKDAFIRTFESLNY